MDDVVTAAKRYQYTVFASTHPACSPTSHIYNRGHPVSLLRAAALQCEQLTQDNSCPMYIVTAKHRVLLTPTVYALACLHGICDNRGRTPHLHSFSQHISVQHCITHAQGATSAATVLIGTLSKYNAVLAYHPCHHHHEQQHHTTLWPHAQLLACWQEFVCRAQR